MSHLLKLLNVAISRKLPFSNSITSQGGHLPLPPWETICLTCSQGSCKFKWCRFPDTQQHLLNLCPRNGGDVHKEAAHKENGNFWTVYSNASIKGREQNLGFEDQWFGTSDLWAYGTVVLCAEHRSLGPSVWSSGHFSSLALLYDLFELARMCTWSVKMPFASLKGEKGRCTNSSGQHAMRMISHLCVHNMQYPCPQSWRQPSTSGARYVREV